MDLAAFHSALSVEEEEPGLVNCHPSDRAMRDLKFHADPLWKRRSQGFIEVVRVNDCLEKDEIDKDSLDLLSHTLFRGEDVFVDHGHAKHRMKPELDMKGCIRGLHQGDPEEHGGHHGGNRASRLLDPHFNHIFDLLGGFRVTGHGNQSVRPEGHPALPEGTANPLLRPGKNPLFSGGKGRSRTRTRTRIRKGIVNPLCLFLGKRRL